MVAQPHLRVEHALWRSGMRLVVGVDEVGMGALCAPVVAAAVLVRPHTRKIAGVRDSKTLSAVQRERLVALIKQRSLAWGVGAASVAEIDRLNIRNAAHLAMLRALAHIPAFDHVLVDGLRISRFEERIGPYTAIVDGDASSYVIACASVVAKVTRDRLMARLARRYPGYGWERNAGYATRDHVAALRELGLTPFHRRTYGRIRAMLEGDQLALGLGDAEPDGSQPLEDAGAAQVSVAPIGPGHVTSDRVPTGTMHAERPRPLSQGRCREG